MSWKVLSYIYLIYLTYDDCYVIMLNADCAGYMQADDFELLYVIIFHERFCHWWCNSLDILGMSCHVLALVSWVYRRCRRLRLHWWTEMLIE